MSNLKNKLIKLAYDKPELRADILPLLKEAADTFKCPECGTKVLEKTGYCVKCKKKVKKGAITVPEDVKSFIRDIEKLYHRHLNGQFGIKAEESFGERLISMKFTVLPKSEWKNGIIQNDPSYTHIYLYESFDETGLSDRMKAEMNMGGKIFDSSNRTYTKVGWRNGSGSPDAILRKLDTYFKRLADMANDLGFY